MDQGTVEPPKASGIPARTPRAGPGAAFRPLVVLFGIVWLINAGFQFTGWVWRSTPDGMSALATVLANAVTAAPPWLRPAVLAIATRIDQIGPREIAAVMVGIALLLGLSLIFQIALRTACCFGMAYSIFCWIALCALGAPYGNGQTDPGVFPAYVIAFLFILSVAALLDRRATTRPVPPTHPSRAIWSTARLLFGLLWLFDAALKWEPYFRSHFLAQLTPAVQGQPAWIATYINFVIQAVAATGPVFVAVIVAIVETALAISLLTGRVLELSVPLGFLYSLAVWTTAEGWGGPYTLAGTGIRGDVIGNVLIYAIIFLFLLVEIMRRLRDRRWIGTSETVGI